MILALKTADNVTHIRLFDAAGQQLAEESWDSGRALADELLARLQNFLKAHKSDFQELKGLVIFSGPGSFTSLRIGHTVVNALAASLNVPVVGSDGESWAQDGIKALASAPTGRPALPHYGAEANITPPKP